MKRFFKVFSLALVLSLSVFVLAACDQIASITQYIQTTTTNNNNQNETTTTTAMNSADAVDYVSQLKLNMSSSSLKVEVTVKSYVDGDTTHFNMPEGVNGEGETFKARYLAINTPESTGQIEEWGKKASKFTKNALSNAESIIVESDDNKWNLDSTGGRYLVWVWYRTSAEEDYKNLNLEILQNGLAIASNTARNRYGEICVNALNQAKALKLNVFSGEKDPDFYYGGAQVVSLKELRANAEKYVGTTVAFEAVVTKNYNSTLNVEDYDEETETYFGMSVYLGYGLSGAGLEIVEMGNRVMFVGSFQFYETGGTYQLSNLRYQIMRPDDPTNIKLISTGNEASFREISADTFNNATVTFDVVDPATEVVETKELSFAEAALNTSIIMKDLYVERVYTTTNETSSSKGAMTLTCKVGNETISVRTEVLKDASGNTITEDAFLHKTINIKGFVEYYSGNYQIKVYSMNDVEFIEEQ